MAQQDILNLLKQKNNWLSSKDISSYLGISKSSVNANLKYLKKFEFVQVKKIPVQNKKQNYLIDFFNFNHKKYK